MTVALVLIVANLSIEAPEDTALAFVERDWEEKRRIVGLRKAALTRAVQEYDIAAQEEALAFRQYSETRSAYDN